MNMEMVSTNGLVRMTFARSEAGIVVVMIHRGAVVALRIDPAEALQLGEWIRSVVPPPGAPAAERGNATAPAEAHYIRV